MRIVRSSVRASAVTIWHVTAYVCPTAPPLSQAVTAVVVLNDTTV